MKRINRTSGLIAIGLGLALGVWVLPLNFGNLISWYQHSGHAALLSDRTLAVEIQATHTYPLTITLPEYPGRRFATLSFSFNQREKPGQVALLPLALSQTQLLLNAASDRQVVQPKSLWLDETGTLWLEFTTPLPPKTPITILFKSDRSLSGSGYEYAIAAYPDNPYPVGVFVGQGTF